jgi:hypothetical protein
MTFFDFGNKKEDNKRCFEMLSATVVHGELILILKTTDITIRMAGEEGNITVLPLQKPILFPGNAMR